MRIAFPTDEHFPYQDDAARQVALKIVSDFDPDIRIAGSDGLDFYNLSRFDKNPIRYKMGGLQEEIDTWMGGQREWLDASPNAAVKFLMGNHEDRLRRYLWKNPAMWGLDVLEISSLLHFEELGISIERTYEELYIHGVLVLKHGRFVRKDSAYSAKAHLLDEHHSVTVLTGHTHRVGNHNVTGRNGIVQSWECGCLCRLDPDFDPSPNWQQAITLIEISEHVPSVETVLIHTKQDKKFAIWRGKEYKE